MLDFMCIDIEKVSENDERCDYRFYTRELDSVNGSIVSGVLQIEKLSGNIFITEQMLGDNDKKVANRAKAKIRKHWQQGEYPDHTAFVSG